MASTAITLKNGTIIRKWVAKSPARILSVWAADEQEARELVSDALGRRGRFEIRRQWQANGSQVELEQD